MKVKILAIALIVSLGINAGTFLTLSYHLWQRGRIGRDADRWRTAHSDRLKHRLDLNEEQIDSMEAMRERMYVKTLPLREKLSARRRELIDLLEGPEPVEPRLGSVIKEIALLQAELEVEIFKNIREIRKTLTPEQQARFLELFERRFHEGDMHFGPPGAGFPPPPEERIPSRK